MVFFAGEKLRAADLQTMEDAIAAVDVVFATLLTTNGSFSSIATNESTASTSYVDLATPGPSVTLTSAGTRAIILWSQHGSNNTANKGAISSIVISGATTLAVSDNNGIIWHEKATAGASYEAMQFMVATINPGSNTYKVQYKVAGGAGTASFERRRCFVFAP